MPVSVRLSIMMKAAKTTHPVEPVASVGAARRGGGGVQVVLDIASLLCRRTISLLQSQGCRLIPERIVLWRHRASRTTLVSVRRQWFGGSQQGKGARGG